MRAMNLHDLHQFLQSSVLLQRSLTKFSSSSYTSENSCTVATMVNPRKKVYPINPILRALHYDESQQSSNSNCRILSLEEFEEYRANCCEKNTALHHAAFYGDLRTVEWLVEMGSDINSISYFRTPLLIACGSVENTVLGPRRSSLGADYFGHIPPRTPYYHQAVAEYLIKKGADINVRDGAYRSALDLSCEVGNLEMVRLLLSLGAEISSSVCCTLRYAVNGGNPAVIRLIMDHLERENRVNNYQFFGILIRENLPEDNIDPRTEKRPCYEFFKKAVKIVSITVFILLVLSLLIFILCYLVIHG